MPPWRRNRRAGPDGSPEWQQMCGISGIVDLNGLDWAATEPRLRSAVEVTAPRGPDGEGLWQDSLCALGHRRLAIVDLSPAGSQPMVRGALAITYNGMIYNYRALRETLARAGHSFTSDSDTEVILAGWQEWGEGLLDRLVGMFAFAIWDGRRRTLWLARDRFGQKPLVYGQVGAGLSFGSDIRAVERLTGGGDLDPAALGLYCRLGYIPAPHTILTGIRKLPPGHVARYDAAGLDLRRWYAYGGDGAQYADETAAAVDLRDAVQTAVAERLVADVPVGAFLSGGIDSAVITACMVRAAPTVRTFTVGFEGVPDYYEERPAAREVAEHLGTRHEEIAVDAGEAQRILDQVFDGLDEPFADSSAVPTWLVSRETRRHVTVALSGDGGDELFGGYRKYQGELLAERYRRWAPRPLRRALIEPAAALLPESKAGQWTEKARRVRRFIRHAGGSAAERQAGWAEMLSAASVRELAPGAAAPDLVALFEQARGGGDPLNAMLAAEIAIGLPGDMLAKVDRMSMAHGLEVRSPFLDHRVAAAAARMPGPFKVARGAGKRILRQAFRDDLPAAVFDRPKKGFEIPVAEWLTGPLRDRTLDAISPARSEGPGRLRLRPARALVPPARNPAAGHRRTALDVDRLPGLVGQAQGVVSAMRADG